MESILYTVTRRKKKRCKNKEKLMKTKQKLETKTETENKSCISPHCTHPHTDTSPPRNNNKAEGKPIEICGKLEKLKSEKLLHPKLTKIYTCIKKKQKPTQTTRKSQRLRTRKKVNKFFVLYIKKKNEILLSKNKHFNFIKIRKKVENRRRRVE